MEVSRANQGGDQGRVWELAKSGPGASLGQCLISDWLRDGDIARNPSSADSLTLPQPAPQYVPVPLPYPSESIRDQELPSAASLARSLAAFLIGREARTGPKS